MGYGKFKFVVWGTWEEISDKLKEMEQDHDWTYLIFGEEFTPTTNKAHIDGYYEIATARKIKTEQNKFTKIFGKGFGDIQLAKGTAKENWNYSSKEKRKFYENGKPAKQGQRKDLLDAQQDINNGTTVDTIAEENPTLYHMYGRTLNKLEDLRMRKLFRNFMTKGIWYWGSTGVGKSRKAFENYSYETHYNLPNDKGWWDNYTQQETVIINDFRGWIPYDELLQMVDMHPFDVRRRGRPPLPFLSKTVIITSSLPPEKVYCNRAVGDSLQQLLRRFTVIEMTAPPTTVWSGNTRADQIDESSYVPYEP